MPCFLIEDVTLSYLSSEYFVEHILVSVEDEADETREKERRLGIEDIKGMKVSHYTGVGLEVTPIECS